MYRTMQDGISLPLQTQARGMRTTQHTPHRTCRIGLLRLFRVLLSFFFFGWRALQRRSRSLSCAWPMLRPALYSLALLPCSAALSGVVRGAAPTRAGRLVMGRKPGVSSPEDISAFIKSAGDKLIVVDVRNPDFSKEPGARACRAFLLSWPALPHPPSPQPSKSKYPSPC
jgi:hypothetical protein